MFDSTTRTLYVSDLDGTLVRTDGTLSDATIGKINDFVANGGLFTYATARSHTSAARITAGLDLRLPLITYGGAIIVDPSGTPREAQFLPPGTVKEVLAQQALHPLVFAVHGGRDRLCWLVGRETPGVSRFLARRAGDPRLLPLSSWDELDPAGVFNISYLAPREELAVLSGGFLSGDVYDTDWWLEYTVASKAAALATLRDEIGATELVCFGDNVNDLSMFAIADRSYAVANAYPEVLAAATGVIASNDDDGVANFLAP